MVFGNVSLKNKFVKKEFHSALDFKAKSIMSVLSVNQHSFYIDINETFIIRQKYVWKKNSEY